MIRRVQEFSPGGVLIDVRSPGEFSRGHVPGARNIPLFSDEERAKVGIRYKEAGRDSAFLLGLELIGPKLADFVREARRLSPSLRVYCFRGGARSASMAWLFDSAGFEVEVLEGGYKAYRRRVLESFEEPQEIVILSGYTGSGKTFVLQELRRSGEQVLDLEGLADHKGSAFGGLHSRSELYSEMFENLIYEQWRRLDRSRRVWIEDESKTLGRVCIPEGLWKQMRAAPVIFMDLAQEKRVPHLVFDYGSLPPARLQDALSRISRRLGPERHRRCLEALETGSYDVVARICLDYYDEAYLYGLSKRDPQKVKRIQVEVLDARCNCEALLAFTGSGRPADTSPAVRS